MPVFRESGILTRYAPGDHPAGEVVGRTTTKGQFDQNGILQQVAVGARADANYIGGVRTTLLEVTRANIAIQNRDLTQAAWVATGITPLRNVVGLDGVANTATRLTATTPLGTILQSVTLASSLRSQSAFIQRITGTGAIAMTTDGGTTWVNVTLAASGWGRCSIPAQTVTNPQFGFRMATSGDVIAVDYVQNETGQDPSSPIATTTIAVTRAGDTGTLPWNIAPRAPLTVYVKYVEQSTDTANQRRFFRIGNSDNNSLILYRVGGLFRWRHCNSVPTATEGNLAVAPAVGSTVEVRGVLLPSGACYVAVSVNGAAEAVGTTSGAVPFSTAWSSPILEFPATGSSALDAIIAFKIARGERTLTEMQQIPIAAERPALPRLATPPRFPMGLQSFGQSGKGQFRSVQNMGRIWQEIYPILDTSVPSVRALIQRINRGLREGIVWDVQHPYWHARNGVGGGANILVQGASQTGNVLNIDGATPNVTNWLREGDVIQVTGCSVIFDVTGDVSTDSSGFAKIPISPPIFVGKSPADNAWVEIDPAAIFFKAAIVDVSDYPNMDTTRYIDAGLTVTFREQPA